MFFSGCSSFVKKPEVNQVKKIAILSVYANDKVVEAKGRGMVQNWDQIFKMQVAEDFLAIYKSSFKKIGWTVVEPTEVLASAEYKAMFEVKQVETSNETVNKVGNFLGDIGSKLMERSNKMNFFSPAGMYAIPFPANEKNCYGDCCLDANASNLWQVEKSSWINQLNGHEWWKSCIYDRIERKVKKYV